MGTHASPSGKRKKGKTAEKMPQNKSDTTPDPQQSTTDVFTAPARESVKPALQLSLTEAELEEEIPQMLTANNPEAAQNITRFHSKERAFKLEAMVEQCAVHYATDGWLVAKTSEEGKRQLETERLQEEALNKLQAEATNRDSSSGEAVDDSKQLRNHFNFSDRACQTINDAPKHRGCYTEPPQTTTRKGSCSQWEIYDDYGKDIEGQRLQEQLNKKRAATAKKTKNQGDVQQTEVVENAEEDSERGVSLRAAKVMERMTMQNIFDEFAMDLKYWEDSSDAFRPTDASLLPLWKFHDETSVGKQVTAINTNPKHSDVFAVGYGSYESLQQTFGLISIYSIKNPTVPEKNVMMESGVLTLAWHPTFPNLLAAGCYDGSVKVVDAKGEMLYASDGVAQRHNEPVWQVSWRRETGLGELQLYSASTDGKLGLWTFTRSEILFEPLMTITNKARMMDGASGVLCLDFSQLEETTYLVGTEEGCIYRCSTEYDSEYLDTYIGHELPVYAVKWNSFHSDVFISASEDWAIRLWDGGMNFNSIMRFELTAPVTDIAWAPYSSTVFAAVTASGYVFVFDIALNRHAAVCEQKVINKGRLTRIVFHPQQPLILIGDNKGIVYSLKLSPNLRKTFINNTREESFDKELDRLNRVLEVARKSVA